LTPARRTTLRTLRRLDITAASCRAASARSSDPLAHELQMDFVAANELEIVDAKN